jgi:two-component system sensor histidine kinase KdpD
LRRLASILDANLIVEEGDDVADTAARIATDRGTTYVLIGQPRPRGPLSRLQEPLTDRLVRKLPGVDIRIVADPR